MPESIIDTERLAYFREKADLSARALSLKIGANEGYVRNLEAGRYNNVSIAIVAAISGELSVGVDALCPALGPQWVSRRRFDPKPIAHYKWTVCHRSKAYLMPDYSDTTRLQNQGWPSGLISTFLQRRHWRVARSEELETVIQPAPFLLRFGDISRLDERTILGLTRDYPLVRELLTSCLPFDRFESVTVYDSDLIEVRVSPDCILQSYHAATVHIAKQAIEHAKAFVPYDMNHPEKNNRWAKQFFHKSR